MALLAELAQQLGDPGAGARAQTAARAEFAALAGGAARFATRDALLFEWGDSRHIRVFGGDSLFSGALEAMGLRNAWTGRARFAFSAPVPLEKLAEYSEARFVMVGDVPPQVARGLRSAALWNSLPPVRERHVHRLPELRPFAGIPSALRFGHELVAALERDA